MSDTVTRQTIEGVPEPVSRIAGIMASYPAPWALCGGWAVDAWLGRESRLHGDIDVIVFQDDLAALREHLSGWQLVAHDADVESTTLYPVWDGRSLKLPAHFHARPDTGEPLPGSPILTPEDGFELDIQICERTAEEWVLLSDPRVGYPLEGVILQSPWKLPTVVPEVLLFYKASELRRRDRIDFLNLLPHLGDAQRRWLGEAISRVRHPWLAELVG